MKIKELIAHLKNFDDELDVYKFDTESGEFFELIYEDIDGESELYDVNGCILSIDEATDICEDEGEEIDDDKIKKVFVI